MNSRLVYDQDTRVLTVKGEIAQDEAMHLRDACDPADRQRGSA